MVRALFPRFALVIVASPLAFVATLLAGARAGVGAQPAAAVAAAVTFAAVVLAPSHKNAAVRAGIAVALAGIAAAAAFLFSA